MKRISKYKLLIIILFCLVLIGPVIINESYKVNKGYLTLWNAADVLSYYGTIIASLIGIAGVYFTVCISNKNYRDDARSRILPYMTVTVLNIKLPDPFLAELGTESYSDMGNNPIIMDSLSGKSHNHFYFVINSLAQVQVVDSLSDNEKESLKSTEVLWHREKDGKMCLHGTTVVSMPFILENIGNGAAKNLRMGFSHINNSPYFRPPITLKQNEEFFIHIFSEQDTNNIDGEYTFNIYYEDILGNQYEQLFPIEILAHDDTICKSFDITGHQRLLQKSH